MATDTDATAARLRERVEAAAIKHDDWSGNFPDALDTLIQYHAAKGAVEALTEAFGDVRVADDTYATERIAGRTARLLAAAQARLAAYEEERWERAQPIIEKPTPELDAFPRCRGSMTTETTDPLETVMELVGELCGRCYCHMDLERGQCPTLRLGVTLVLARVRYAVADGCDSAPGCHDTLTAAQAEIAICEQELA